MTDYLKLYIDGKWVAPAEPRTLGVVNPATEEVFAHISIGSTADVDRAVAAARRAFESYSRTSRPERRALLRRIIAVYQRRAEDLAAAVTAEMGAPLEFSRTSQVPGGLSHFLTTAEVLERYEFEQRRGSTTVLREPIGVCGLITPWNWPLNQIACKVAPALAAGCTMVLKPSEIAPIDACLLAEIFDEAGVPPGVFNLVNGDGPGVGQAIAAHPGIDMVSFTGSTRAGILIAKAAADTVKRVTQELGGKSPNIILDDADFELAVRRGAESCFRNSGQSCNAPTRMLVPAARQREAAGIAGKVAATTKVGDPGAADVMLGPLVSAVQFDKVQTLIRTGMQEGATLIAGGPGRPEGLEKGYFARPTVFADVRNNMSIAREEVFGPVLCILPYRDEEEAISIANDTIYGLAAYVWSGNSDRARRVAGRLRAGSIRVNGAAWDDEAPFGGYKRSGNGRECGEFGLEEFLEIKAVMG